MIDLLIEYRVVVFAVIVAAWFMSFFILITCLCIAAKDDLAEAPAPDVERRLAPYGSQAAHDYAARRLIAEATSDIPYRLLEEWVEQ